MTLKESRLTLVADIVRPKFAEFHARAQRAGFPLLIVRTWSSVEDQLRLYAKGRRVDLESDTGWTVSDKRQVVTQALPDQTPHTVIGVDGRPAALAMDIIPVDPAGLALWPQPNESTEALAARWKSAFGKSESDCWKALWDLAATCGLDALGDPWGAYLRYDLGHFEEPGWRLMVQQAGGLMLPNWRGHERVADRV